MRGVDMHVHLPTAAWVCACVGPDIDSIERWPGWRYRYLPDDVRREMRRRLAGQVSFGTDYFMFDPEACLDALDLPEPVAQRILRDTAAELLALDGAAAA